MPDSSFASENNATVACVAADTSGWSILAAAEQLLAEFGVSSRRMEGDEAHSSTVDSSRERLRAVIVTSPDANLAGAWARTTGLPVVRVPVQGDSPRGGIDLLQDTHGELPSGDEGGEFATMAIGQAGAKNAALFIVSVLALTDEVLHKKWTAFRERQTAAVLAVPPLQMDAA